MRVYIAEKPSLARAIADGLGGGKSERHSIRLHNGDIVAWAAGHLLNQCSPDEYGEAYKKWSLEMLPIIPEQWKMKPRKEAGDLLANLKTLLKQADEAVNAGDADREGQLLIDELLEWFGYKGPVLRLLVTDTTPAGVRKACEAMKNNDYYRGLKLAALARSRADWLHGMNTTRMVTLLARRQGYRGEVLRMGRVKTPVMALVARRDKEIEGFQSQPYYELYVRGRYNDQPVALKWIPDEEAAGLDAEGRLIDPLKAQALLEEVNGKSLVITQSVSKERTIPSPLGFSLPKLQIEASRAYGISPADTLKICQELYEAKLITYPRSDCEYAPLNLLQDAPATVSALYSRLKDIQTGDLVPDLGKKASLWNDAKVAEHYAILPTAHEAPFEFSKEQERIYRLIALRYLSFFLPDGKEQVISLTGQIGSLHFRAGGKKLLSAGWKALLGGAEQSDDRGEVPEENFPLPFVPQGSALTVQGELKNKNTMPPARFTEATLLSAMNTIHRYVQDERIKKILKENAGLGTAATQAKIIEELITGGLLVKNKKQIVSSPVARALTDGLPKTMTLPDMTAHWESLFKEITDDANLFDNAMEQFREGTVKLLDQLQKDFHVDVSLLEGQQHTPQLQGKTPSGKGEKICPLCGASMVKRKGKFGDFYGCSKYPNCKGVIAVKKKQQ